MKVDVAIVGGGVIGSAIAYFLARDERSGSIIVIEPDPSYQNATTPQGAGGVRQLFSLPEHIRMSRYSLAFYRGFDETMAIDGERADIDFKAHGYLFVATKQGAKQLEANYRLQATEGVRAELLDVDALKRRFPSIGTGDVALAVHSPDDGWIDPEAALRGFRRKAQHLGVRYLKDRVQRFESSDGRVKAGALASGNAIEAEFFVNAAGPWADEVGRMAGMALPVRPMCRLQHYWLCRGEIEPLPLVKDETGLFFRPEGQGYVGGCPSFEVTPGFLFEHTDGRFKAQFGNYFEEVVWPLLGNRVPKFEALRCVRSWAGHYAQNSLDGNMILGPWTGVYNNFYVACGLAGHGIMHAPAVGLAMAELLLDGQFLTMDLSHLGYERVTHNAPYPERGII